MRKGFHLFRPVVYARAMAAAVRVDVWLWAVRVFRTRTASTTACASGNVRVNDLIAKPSRTIVAGDRVTAKVGSRQRVLEVVETPKKRVGAGPAAEAVIDYSPPPEPRPGRAPKSAVRLPGAGRPTKRDRRQIDKLRGRDDDAHS